MKRRGRVGPGLAAAAAVAMACATRLSAPRPVECPVPGPRTAPAPSFEIEGDARRGARLFLDRCGGCHATQPSMRIADAPPSAPRLDCPDWLATVDAAYLYHAINRGPGLYGHGSDPPLGLSLAPMDVADLVAYLESLEER